MPPPRRMHTAGQTTYWMGMGIKLLKFQLGEPIVTRLTKNKQLNNGVILASGIPHANNRVPTPRGGPRIG